MQSGICFCYGEFSLQVHRPVESADSQVRGCRTPRAPLSWEEGAGCKFSLHCGPPAPQELSSTCASNQGWQDSDQ